MGCTQAVTQTIVSEDLIGTGGRSQAYLHGCWKEALAHHGLFNRAAHDMASPRVSDPNGNVVKAGAAIF